MQRYHHMTDHMTDHMSHYLCKGEKVKQLVRMVEVEKATHHLKQRQGATRSLGERGGGERGEGGGGEGGR